MKGVYEACYYGGLVLAIVFVIAAVAFFVVFKIPKVVGDLTGQNAKKSMKNMNEHKAAARDTESKKERAKYYNENTGKIKVRDAVAEETEVLPAKREKNADFHFVEQKDIGQIDMSKAADGDEEVTDVLRSADGDEEVTDVLRSADGDEEVTDVLRSTDGDEEVTDVLRSADDYDDVTDVLRSADGDDDVTDVLRSADEDDDVTDVLRSTDVDDDVTDVLRSTGVDDDVTDVLRSTKQDEASTDVLRDYDASTTVLTGRGSGISDREVKIIYNVIEIHTDETI